MSKIAVVGVEGSGKTVLMSAFGDKYKRPDENGIFLSPEDPVAFGFVEVLMNRMRNGEWPAATMIDTPRSLEWGLYHKKNEENEKLCDIQFLDFAGEVYRFAFGTKHTQEEMANSEASISKLKIFINNSDALIVLFNLGDAINGDVNDERTREAQWLSKGILDYVFGKTKIKKALMVFTQADSYRAVIEQHGGIAATYRHYLPHVANLYDDVPTIAVSAINRTVPDAAGHAVPAQGFTSEGLDEIMEWIISNIPGYEDFFKEIKQRRRDFQVMYNCVKESREKYEKQVEACAPSHERRFSAIAFYEAMQKLQELLNAHNDLKLDAKERENLVMCAAYACEFESKVSELLATVRYDNVDRVQQSFENLFSRHPEASGLAGRIKSEIEQRRDEAHQRLLEAQARSKRRRKIAAMFGAIVLVGNMAIWGCHFLEKIQRMNREREAQQIKELSTQNANQYQSLRAQYYDLEKKHGNISRDSDFGSLVASFLYDLNFGGYTYSSQRSLKYETVMKGKLESAKRMLDRIRTNLPLRDEAKKTYEKVSEKKADAEKYEAHKFAAHLYQKSISLCSMADQYYKEKNFSDAVKQYERAEQSFDDAIAMAREQKVKYLVEKALLAERTSDWKKVGDLGREALAIEGNNKEGIRLLKKFEKLGSEVIMAWAIKTEKEILADKCDGQKYASKKYQEAQLMQKDAAEKYNKGDWESAIVEYKLATEKFTEVVEESRIKKLESIFTEITKADALSDWNAVLDLLEKILNLDAKSERAKCYKEKAIINNFRGIVKMPNDIELEVKRIDAGGDDAATKKINDFWMGKVEVTQEQYEVLMKENPSWFSSSGKGSRKVTGLNTGKFPVECVSWVDATNFCAKLTAYAHTNNVIPETWKFDLPTETQWEYACRANTTTAFSYGDQPDGYRMNFDSGDDTGINRKRTVETAELNSKNNFGLYDMHGNVAEWCREGSDTTSSGQVRAIRGGSWSQDAEFCQSGFRGSFDPTKSLNIIGFRVVLNEK